MSANQNNVAKLKTVTIEKHVMMRGIRSRLIYRLVCYLKT